MKLKLVVASMSILGLVSWPAFADTTTKSKNHHKVQHKMVVEKHETEEREDHPDYKDMGPVAEVCSISQTSMIMNEMTQSMNRSMPNPCNPDWFKRIQLSGGISVQNAWGNRNRNFMGEGYQHLALNDVYLNIGAVINEWSKAFASISYNTETINDPLSGKSTVFNHVGEYSSAYSNNANGGATNALQIEQAYMTLGNFDMSPVFVQLGKQYQDFSRYEIHPIERSLTQVMSETLATSAKVGFIANGFNGSVYAFDDILSKIGQTSKATNYGAALGYDYPSDQLGFDLGAAYLYNLIGVNDIAYNVGQFTKNNANNLNDFGFHSRVGGVAVYADVNSGPFTLGARWTTAIQRFSVLDLPKHGTADLLATGVPMATASGAKPWAAGIQAGYGFDAWGKNQNVYLGYQASREAAGLQIPQGRWLVGYGIEAWRNTDFGLEWDHDQAYARGNGGSGNNSNLVNLRAGVKFS